MSKAPELHPDISAAYTTEFGRAYCGDSLELLPLLQNDSVNLFITSPPFALLRKKSYGNEEQSKYVQWLAEFASIAREKLTSDGSFVLDLGGAYRRGVPSRSLYNFRVLLEFCDNLGFHLAEDFYWFNPSKLPSPIEWVNKRKIRAKDAVNTVWWFSKTEWPKSDVRNVLSPYSPRMQKLLRDPDKYYDEAKRPSGHDISKGFSRNNGGALPSNLLQIPNSESNSLYLRHCKTVGVPRHPARFPAKLPEFFIKMLTDENDLVVDFFSGSNTTGQVCEELSRRWLSFELDSEYVQSSAFRFLGKSVSKNRLTEVANKVVSGRPVHLSAPTEASLLED